ncbi:MAG: S8 family serine peptidase, partial [Saprospiraceae bacterium]
HANIMASLVGGAGNAELRGRGAAPGCQLVSSSFVGLQPDADYSTLNITVQNHSYGIDIQNWYGYGAQLYDRTTQEHPRLLHVFSAGNKGDSTSKSGTYAGILNFANLSGNFKMAKNILVVGAVDSLGQVNPLSSRGPAYDGRTKPDLVAFGQDGTSGAAALVSGSAAVIQQSLTNDLSRSDLVRAIMVNTADDIGAPGPDYESGFGNLNLPKAVLLSESKNFSMHTLAEGQIHSIPINIPSNLRQFKITLAWNDPSPDLFAPKALLHDLDLSLLDPLGNEYLPWILNTFPHPDSLRRAAHPGRDTLNNIEQITLEFPSEGLWEIRVTGSKISSGDQDFALAWSWDTLQHFEWSYPYKNDPAPANTEVILRWLTNLPDTFARIEWRAGPNADWRLVKDSVQLQRGWQRWILPDTFAESQLRMVVGGYAYISNIFLISKELRMKIGFNCPDSVMLFWNKAHPNAQYQLYGLGAKYLDSIAMLSDTFMVLQKSAYPQTRFAVAPRSPGQGVLGLRSPAPDISKQGVECYFQGFLADLNEHSGVNLNLSIGTNYGLSKIFFEKQSAAGFIGLDEQPAEQLDYGFLDEFPQKGFNAYRTRLMLDNGAILLSDTVSVYFAGEQNWWVFPNPVPAQGVLNLVVSTVEPAEFWLFDVLGKLVLERTFDDLSVEISLGGLPKGVYFYKINDGKSFMGGGKLVVE